MFKGELFPLINIDLAYDVIGDPKVYEIRSSMTVVLQREAK